MPGRHEQQHGGLSGQVGLGLAHSYLGWQSWQEGLPIGLGAEDTQQCRLPAWELCLRAANGSKAQVITILSIDE